MKTSTEQPEIFNTLAERFGVTWNEVVITYGDTVYAAGLISDDLVIHEGVHVRQQAEYEGGYKAWWERYLNDDKFRLSQEIEAYREQYKFLRSRMKDRNKLAVTAHGIATTLSGSMYGNIISYQAAKLQITS